MLVSLVVTDEIERGNAVVIASHGLTIDDAGARARAGQRIDDQREGVGEIIAGTAVEPHARPVLSSDNAKTVMLDLVQPLAAVRNFVVLIRRHGAMNPAGRVRGNMWAESRCETVPVNEKASTEPGL
jgi:hypothetical protein